jgi:endonuclease III
MGVTQNKRAAFHPIIVSFLFYKMDDIGVSGQELVKLTIKALNKKIKKNGISKDRAKQLKEQRRRLKNRYLKLLLLADLLRRFPLTHMKWDVQLWVFGSLF